MTSTDRIEKTIMLKATPARVWRALSDSREFEQWFRVKLQGGFEPGTSVRGHVTYPGYEHLKFEMWIERMEPERYFAYRWHPYAIDPDIDYSSEPTTLVEFRLEPQPGGTQLSIVESGFDNIPEGRRAEAFRMNSGGWAEQAQNIERHVTA